MPNLPILGSDGKLVPIAPVLTLAVMTYPDEKAAREEFAASVLVGLIESPENKDLSSLGFLVPVLRTAPTPKVLAGNVQRAAKSSWVATTVLSLMLSAAHHHSKVKRHAKRFFYVIDELIAGPPTDRTFQQAWKTFRSVAHLDLAVSALASAHGVPTATAKDIAAFDVFAFVSKHFQEYLTYAESIRRAVEKHRLVASKELWRVPPALELPEIDLRYPPLPESVLTALASYQPDHPGRKHLGK